tara:strand:+ start:623 stop:1093 length:471 start_codon:yes stop_codon:yes gene_type:complete
MNIIIIAAMTKQGRVIGKDNSLPWDIPEEMKLFRSYTKDSTVILGRKTFESVGSKPLPNRNNIIVSTSLPEQEGVDVCRNIKNSIEKAKSYNKEIYILGGATIYEQSFQFANKMYLSFIKKEYEGNTIFPKWSDDEWKIVSKEDHEEFEFVIFNKK